MQVPHELPGNAVLRRGQEMGGFRHGSTVLMPAPQGFGLHPSLTVGAMIRVGEALLRNPGGRRGVVAIGSSGG